MRAMSIFRRGTPWLTAVVVATSLGCGTSSRPNGSSGQSGQSGQGGGRSSGSAGTTGSVGGGAGGSAATSGAAGTGDAGAGVDGGAAGATADAAADTAADGSDARPDGATGAGCTAPGTICWDFEEGKLPPGWTPYRNEYPTGSLLVDSTRAHHGTYALHAKDFTGGKEGADGGPKHTIRYALPAGFGPVLWGRAFIYMSPATPMSHAGFFNARYPRPNDPVATNTDVSKLDWYEVATSGGNYVSIWHPPEPPGTPEAVQISATPGATGRWACVEWLFDAEDGDAAEAADPRVWLDGVEIAWPMSIVVPTGPRPVHEKAKSFTVLEAGVYLYQGLTTATNWWIDDLGVGKQRIGCD
jgi:hypothetical protein